MNQALCVYVISIALVGFLTKDAEAISLWDEDSADNEELPQLRGDCDGDAYGGNAFFDDEVPRAADNDSDSVSPVDDVVEVLKRLYSSYRQCLRAQPCATRKGRRYVSGCRCPRQRSCQASGRGMYQCL